MASLNDERMAIVLLLVFLFVVRRRTGCERRATVCEPRAAATDGRGSGAGHARQGCACALFERRFRTFFLCVCVCVCVCVRVCVCVGAVVNR